MISQSVTIAIPVFNSQNTIGATIESLLAQSFKDFNIIISDNSSTDNTEKICRQYSKKHKKISYFRHSKNKGHVFNFIFLCSKANSKYFMWVAADDIYLPQFLESCVSALEKDLNAKFAMTDYKILSRFSKIFNLRISNHPLSCIEIPDKEKRLLTYSELTDFTYKDNLIYSLWRKEFIQSIVLELKDIYVNFDARLHHINQCALYKSYGKYIPCVYFLKYYPKLPPGHYLNPIIGMIRRVVYPIKEIIFFFKNNKKTDIKKIDDTTQQYVNNTKKVLKRIGVKKNSIKKIITFIIEQQKDKRKRKF